MCCLDRRGSFVTVLPRKDSFDREKESKLDQFLHDWLNGEIITEEGWKRRAEVCSCRIPDDAALVAVLVELPAGGAESRLREACCRRRSRGGRMAERLLLAFVGEELAAVLPISREKPTAVDKESALFASLENLREELMGYFKAAGLRLYAGSAVERQEDLKDSWAQAKRARQVAEACGLPGEVVSYDKLGVYSLLYLIPSGEEREQFMNRYSLPLQLADRKGGGRLTETLEMYFRCNGNIKLTSEKLFAHYNTIVYRLAKVQAILGVSLDDPEDRLQLQLALKLGRIAPNLPTD